MFLNFPLPATPPTGVCHTVLLAALLGALSRVFERVRSGSSVKALSGAGGFHLPTFENRLSFLKKSVDSFFLVLRLEGESKQFGLVV